MVEHNFRCILPNNKIEYDNFNMCKPYVKIYFLIDYTNNYINNHTEYSYSNGLFVIINNIVKNALFLDRFFRFLKYSDIAELHLIFSNINFDVIKYMNKYAMKKLKKLSIMCWPSRHKYKPTITDLENFFQIYHNLEFIKLKNIMMFRGINEIGKYVKENKYLKTLSLHNIDINEKDLKMLCKNISLNNKLEKIEIIDDYIEHYDMMQIMCSQLMYNTNIKNIITCEHHTFNEMVFWQFLSDLKHDYHVQYNLIYFFDYNDMSRSKHNNFFTMLCCAKRNNLIRCIPKYIKIMICDYVDLHCIKEKIDVITNIYKQVVIVNKSVMPHKYEINLPYYCQEVY